MKYEVDLERLVRCVRYDRQWLTPFRMNAAELASIIAGYHYGRRLNVKRDPVNLLSMYQSIVGRQLIPKAPRFMLTTHDRAMRAHVSVCQAWLSQWVEDIGLARTLMEVVYDALACVGITKTCIASPADAERTGFRVQAGDAIVSRVSLDDVVFETGARRLSECRYVGHRFWMPTRMAEDVYGRKVPVTRPSSFNAEGDARARSISEGEFPQQEDFEDMSCLWEIYVPRHKVVYVFSSSAMGGPDLTEDGKALEEREYVGPPSGMYDFWDFGLVADNLMPKAPMSDLRLIHEAANVAYRKLVDVTVDMKHVGLVRSTNVDDADRIVAARNGDVVAVSDPGSVSEAVFGAKISQPLNGFAELWKSLFSFVGGNLELMGGRSPQSGTARQEALLNENASVGISDMQSVVLQRTKSVGEKLVWLWWNHPDKMMEVDYAVPGVPEARMTRRLGGYDPSSVESVARLAAGELTRTGPVPTIRVDPYSLSASTPESRSRRLKEFVMQVYTPLAPLFQQYGLSLDPSYLLKKIAEYEDQPDLPELLQQMEVMRPEPLDLSGARVETGEPKEVIRRSVSTRDSQSTARDSVARMFGADVGGAPEGEQNAF